MNSLLNKELNLNMNEYLRRLARTPIAPSAKSLLHVEPRIDNVLMLALLLKFSANPI